MKLIAVEEDGVTVVEGTVGVRLLSNADDASRVLEACFSSATRAVLLYAENLPESFFDLSSGQAGAVLQKLRNYGVRLAVIAPRGRLEASRRFGEMLEEERRKDHFRTFETRAEARAWLAGSGVRPGTR